MQPRQYEVERAADVLQRLPAKVEAMRIYRSLYLSGLTVGFAAASCTGMASLQFSESFDYGVGNLAGDGPPAGHPAGQTGWFPVHGAPKVTSPSLSYPGVVSAGNTATIARAVGGNGDVAFADMSPVGGAGGGTEWFAFLMNQASGGPNPNGFAEVQLRSPGTQDFVSFGMLMNRNL